MTLSYIPSDTNDEGILKATASGVLPNGKPVIVNTDGTVSVVEETSVSQSLGSTSVFESAVTGFIASTFDSSNNKVVIAYTDESNSYYGTAVVGTVSGTSISFGTPVVFSSSETQDNTATFDTNSNKVVIAYKDVGNSYYGTAVVGTVSGTSISFGSPAVFSSTNSAYGSVVFDSTNNKVVMVFRDFGNSSYATAVVGTVSGTSISFGSKVVFASATTSFFSATFDNVNGKVVASYIDYSNSAYPTVAVGEVSGTSISFGTPVVLESVEGESPACTFDSNAGKAVMCWRRSGDSSDSGIAVVGTVSGTSISLGSSTVFESNRSGSLFATFDSYAGKVVVCYQDINNSSRGTLRAGTVSGTSISFGSPVVFDSSTVQYPTLTFDNSSNQVVVAYTDNGNSSYGTSVVFRNAATVTNLTSESYIGISTGGTYASGSNATVKIIGNTSDEQSGLTAGQAYYVQTDGTIGTTPDDPSVFAGTAISATKLIVKT